MKRLIIASIYFFISFNLFAQSKTQNASYQQFDLRDSSKIIGTVVFENAAVIQIRDLNGNETRINKNNIVSRKSVIVEKQLVDSITVAENIITMSEQTDSTIVRLELIGGSVLIGTISAEDTSSITITLLSNIETTFRKNLIIKREIVSTNIQKGQYWIPDPNSTRLFFAPTGRGLRSGKGYFSVYEIFFPMIAVGIADYFTFAGGMSLLPGASDQLLYVAPKITLYQDENNAISIGDFFVQFPNDDDYLNIVYSVGTISFNKGAITLGAGYDTFSKKPMFLIGGELRISRYSKLITENWFIQDSDFNFASLGFRFLGENLAADFAFIIPIGDDEDITFVPWIGFAYNF